MLFRGLGQHRAVGSAGVRRSGPPARRQLVVLAAVLIVCGYLLARGAEPTGTQALFTSSTKGQNDSVRGGHWGPQPTPPECANMEFDAVIVLTDGDDDYTAPHGASRKLIFGLDGNDVIRGGNQNDCLVGGAGDDQLFGENGQDVLLGGDGNDDPVDGGNGKDALYGGPGDDIIDGSNGSDTIDGGAGLDTCDGGHAPDLVNCETTP